MDSVLIQVSQIFCVHQRILYEKKYARVWKRMQKYAKNYSEVLEKYWEVTKKVVEKNLDHTDKVQGKYREN